MRKVKDGGLDYNYYYEVTARNAKKTVLVARSSTGRLSYLLRRGLIYVLDKVVKRIK